MSPEENAVMKAAYAYAAAHKARGCTAPVIGQCVGAAAQALLEASTKLGESYETITKIAGKLAKAGYAKEQITAGLTYAFNQRAATEMECWVLALSRILYSDDQLAAGARFSVEA